MPNQFYVDKILSFCYFDIFSKLK